jgi:hypothetical protein
VIQPAFARTLRTRTARDYEQHQHVQRPHALVGHPPALEYLHVTGFVNGALRASLRDRLTPTIDKPGSCEGFAPIGGYPQPGPAPPYGPGPGRQPPLCPCARTASHFPTSVAAHRAPDRCACSLSGLRARQPRSPIRAAERHRPCPHCRPWFFADHPERTPGTRPPASPALSPQGQRPAQPERSTHDNCRTANDEHHDQVRRVRDKDRMSPYSVVSRPGHDVCIDPI